MYRIANCGTNLFNFMSSIYSAIPIFVFLLNFVFKFCCSRSLPLSLLAGAAIDVDGGLSSQMHEARHTQIVFSLSVALQRHTITLWTKRIIIINKQEKRMLWLPHYTRVGMWCVSLVTRSPAQRLHRSHYFCVCVLCCVYFFLLLFTFQFYCCAAH